jgi:DNA-binding LytR/AlgR family response regulator
MENFGINILIVEDDIVLAIDTEMIVVEMGYTVIGRADNSVDALRIIEQDKPDLILMDIDIKGNLTGIQIAEKIKHADIPVLFITNFNDQEHYNKAAKTNHIGYMIKPVNKFTLRSAIESAFRKLANETKEDHSFPFKDTIFFKKRGLLYRIKIPSILFVRADNDYTITVTDEGEFISAMRMFELCKLLEPFNFVKTHRSYIVNLNKINTVDNRKSLLKIGTHDIPISRSNKTLVIEKLKLST